MYLFLSWVTQPESAQKITNVYLIQEAPVQIPHVTVTGDDKKQKKEKKRKKKQMTEQTEVRKFPFLFPLKCAHHLMSLVSVSTQTKCRFVLLQKTVTSTGSKSCTSNFVIKTRCFKGAEKQLRTAKSLKNVGIQITIEGTL